MKRIGIWFLAVAVLGFGLGGVATAATAYEWTQNGFAGISHHGTTGPVLADDFIPALGGLITQVEWWGSSAGSTQWEITIHADDLTGLPAYPYMSQHVVSATGTSVGSGMYHYSAAWAPQDVTLVAGTKYWFSVANFEVDWTWAEPTGAPTVGSQASTSVRSIGGAPSVVAGPHDGPWTTTSPDFTDLAFRITVPDLVPVPAAAWLGLCMLGGLATVRRMRRRS